MMTRLSFFYDEQCQMPMLALSGPAAGSREQRPWPSALVITGNQVCGCASPTTIDCVFERILRLHSNAEHVFSCLICLMSDFLISDF